MKCAHLLLQCVLVSSRPLLVEELAEFLALDFDAKPLPKLQAGWRMEDPEDALLSTCPGLLAVVEVNGSRTIQFSHFTVKGSLVSSRFALGKDRRSLDTARAHAIVAQACLGVLLSLDGEVSGDSLEKFPLAKYAARHWADHARCNPGNASYGPDRTWDVLLRNISDATNLLFDPSKPHFPIWTSIFDLDEHRRSPPRTKSSSQIRGTSLHYAVMYDLPDVVRTLLKASRQFVNDVGARTSHNQTPLTVASEMGHLEVARILLDHGAQCNTGDGNNRPPLHWASQKGHSDIVQLLLDKGGDTRKQDGRRRTPLHWASQEGHLDVCRLLLDRGADVNSAGDSGQKPLHLASRNGHHKVARLLIDRRASVNAKGDSGLTPLHLASREGCLKVVQLLLVHRPDANAQDDDGQTALHLASRQGHFKIVQALLEHGAGSVDVQTYDGQTPFQVASARGHQEIMQLLLQYGATGDEADGGPESAEGSPAV
jgi:ankyrin repeat protein